MSDATPIIPDDARRLIDAAIDETISDTDWADLCARMKSDRDLRTCYIRRRTLHAALTWEARDAEQASAAPARPASASRSCVPRMHTRHASLQRGMVYAAAAALLIAAAAVAIYVSYFSNPQSAIRNPQSTAPVATVIDTTGNLIVNDTIANPGDIIRTGPISLDAGSAEFRLDNGVSFSLRGATQLVVGDLMHATLTRGEAAFDCPPAAKGYTVHLPDGVRVTDLGTRFAVRVAAPGEIRIAVDQGRVRVEDGDQAFTLTEGMIATRSGDRFEVMPALVAVIDDFERVDDWAVYRGLNAGEPNSVTIDEDAPEGRASGRFSYAHTEAREYDYVRFTKTLDAPLDVTGKTLAVAFKAPARSPDASPMNFIQLRLISDAGGFLEYTMSAEQCTGRWRTLLLPIDAFAAWPDPNPPDLTRIVKVQFESLGDVSRRPTLSRFHVDRLGLIAGPAPDHRSPNAAPADDSAAASP